MAFLPGALVVFQAVVMFVPLAIYFWGLALVHRSRRPAVVGGLQDSCTLLLALSGLVVAGPAGSPVVIEQFRAHPLATLVVGALGLAVLSSLLTWGAGRRIVVYQADESMVRAALAEVERDPSIRFEFESFRILRNVTVTVHGCEAERVVQRLLPALRRRLEGQAVPAGRAAWAFFAAAAVLIAVPVIVAIHPDRAAVSGRSPLPRPPAVQPRMVP